MTDPLPHLPDLMLVDRCAQGEQAAARELFRTHQARVHATLYRVLGANRDMEDLLQETFIQVFRSLRGFRGEARLGTWIDRIAARVAYRYLSQRKGAAGTATFDEEGPYVPVHRVEAADQMLAREGVRRFYAALDELGPASRLAFTLHEVDGRSLAEVADLCGTSVTTAKLRVWRARRALMKRAEGDAVLGEFLRQGA